MSKQLILSELLTPPEARECGTNHRPSEVGMQGSHSGESGRGRGIGDFNTRRFGLLPDVVSQCLPADEGDRDLSQI